MTSGHPTAKHGMQYIYMDNRIRKSTGPPCEIRTNECLWMILCSGIDVRVLQGPKGPSAPSSAGFRALGSNSSALLAICLLHNHKKLGVRVFKLKTKDCYFLDLFWTLKRFWSVAWDQYSWNQRWSDEIADESATKLRGRHTLKYSNEQKKQINFSACQH